MALRAKDVGGEFLTSREYQVDIYEHAIKQDSILLMPSGTGKTYIAILLMKHMAPKLGPDKKTAVFVVDRTTLLDQQCEQIQMNTTLKVGKWTTGHGACNLETNFGKFVKDNDVVVVNAQVLVEALMHNIVDESAFALVVIDECHYCLGIQHPYRQLARRLKNFKKKEKTETMRIIGLTSCALNQNVEAERISERIVLLENTLGARIISSDALIQNSKYLNKPKELVVYYSKNSENENYDFSILYNFEIFLHSLGDFDNLTDPRPFIFECLRKIKGVMEDCGIYSAYHVTKNCIKMTEKFLNQSYISFKHLIIFSTAISTFKCFCLPLEQKFNGFNSFEKISPYLSRQVLLILEALENFNNHLNPKINPLTAIIFLERKCSVLAFTNLLKFLSKTTPRFSFIKPDCTVGRGGNSEIEGPDSGEGFRQKSKNLTDVIANFRKNEKNVVVSTKVLEEGIDIRSCNLVIKGSVPSTYSSYIQSRGRARMSPSLYLMLCPDTEMNFCQSKLAKYRRIEKLLADRLPCLKNIAPDRTMLSEDITPDDVMEGYKTPSGAEVTMSSAISLINKYCARLPSDVFTRLTAQAKCNRIGKFYFSLLKFPINSPIKEIIIGEKFTSMRLADMGVALKACRILHERGEIDDNLLPLTKDKVSNIFELADEFEEYGANVPRKTGCAKKRRVYRRCISKYLTDGLPNVGKNFNIYLIEMDLVEPISEQSNPKKRKIINPKNTPYIFGLCTTKKLPPIPPFPVYQRQGKVIARFKLYKNTVEFTAEKFELIKDFHAYIFEEILQMKTDMIFCPEKAPFSTLLIPLKQIPGGSSEEYEIDYHVARDTVKGFPNPPTDEERRNFKYDSELYRDAVVKPWYRQNERDAYYIGEVETEVFPTSEFADQKYETFGNYFKEKYGIEIYHPEYPLLDVDNTSNRMNLLLPRIVQAKTFKRSLDHNQKQFMVPELVSIHPMPASFWIMVIELPTVLFRMNCLLLADEFRARVSTALGLVPNPPDDFEWEELSYPIPQNTNFSGVRSIDQLKKVNALMAAEDGIKDDSEEKLKDEIDFEIGVWDPSLGDKYKDIPLNDPGEEKIINPMVVDEDDYMLEDDSGWNQIAIDMVDISGAKEKIKNISIEDCPVLGWDDDNVEIIQPLDGELAIGTVLGLDPEGLTRDIARINPGEPVSKKRKNEIFGTDEIHEDEQGSKDEFNSDPGLLVSDVCSRPESPDLILDFVEIKKSISPILEDVFDEDIEDLILEDNGKIEFYKITVSELPDFMKDWFVWDKSDLHPYGVPPTVLIQALTTSSASDGFSLERLETIGDSFLKLSVTNYLYNKYPDQHEGRLSSIRSKEVSNANLFRLGKINGIPSIMECSKFDPTVNWLPPGFVVESPGFDESIADVDDDEIKPSDGWGTDPDTDGIKTIDGVETLVLTEPKVDIDLPPYSINHLYQQNISDKAIADCVEALIGAHLISLGPKRTLGLMNWLKIHVLTEKPELKSPVEIGLPRDRQDKLPYYQAKIEKLYNDNRFHLLEERIGYYFRDRSYLIQAFTHGSYNYSLVTSCYQRLEFLGDAVLDYLITRYLFESNMNYSPGVLTDLRSALVNNVIFASLAVKYEMHKFLLHNTTTLFPMINKFVKLQNQNGEINFNDEMYMVTEDEVMEGEEQDVEVPKALGDIFESVAGAVYLDCEMDLEIVWRIFYNIMKDSIEKCCQNPPQSPIRELFELKNHKVRFTKVERLVDKAAARVTVDIDHGKFHFTGVGRSYRIAKTTAAKAALRYLRRLDSGH